MIDTEGDYVEWSFPAEPGAVRGARTVVRGQLRSWGLDALGLPQFWLIAGQRLYLFYSKEARAEFAAQAQSLLSLAERRWPDVQRCLR